MSVVPESSTGPRNRFREMIAAHVLVLVLVLHNYAVTVSSTGAEDQFQADDNGHVGRPCEVSLAPPYPKTLCELRGLCRHTYFGTRTCGGSENQCHRSERVLNQGFQRNPSHPSCPLLCSVSSTKMLNTVHVWVWGVTL